MKSIVVEAILFAVASALTCNAQLTFTEYPGPATPIFEGGYTMVSLTAGPDGNLWFTENYAFGVPTSIGRITPGGTTTYFTIPGGSSEGGITTGPDGNLWFTEYRANRIGRLTTSGTFTEFVIPGFAFPGDICAGPDGNLWFTVSFGTAEVGRITPAGVITIFPTSGFASRIAAGADGNLWFTIPGGDKIARITPAGVITEFLLTPGADPTGIVLGPDGNIWFTEAVAGKIGKITPAGVITLFSLPPGSNPTFIAVGPDNNLWFTDDVSNQLGRITPTGAITLFPVPTPSRGAGIATGPDGNLWFIEANANRIVKTSIFQIPGSVLVGYAVNLNVNDSILNLTSSGKTNLCANIYVFAPDEQLVSCCSCTVTPSGLMSLSARQDLVSNTLTPAIESTVAVKIVSTSGGACDPAALPTLTAELSAWIANTHAAPGGGYATTEVPLIHATPGNEILRLTQMCGLIRSNGSGYGICASCRSGALGGQKR